MHYLRFGMRCCNSAAESQTMRFNARAPGCSKTSSVAAGCAARVGEERRADGNSVTSKRRNQRPSGRNERGICSKNVPPLDWHAGGRSAQRAQPGCAEAPDGCRAPHSRYSMRLPVREKPPKCASRDDRHGSPHGAQTCCQADHDQRHVYQVHGKLLGNQSCFNATSCDECGVMPARAALPHRQCRDNVSPVPRLREDLHLSVRMLRMLSSTPSRLGDNERRSP